jgi:uncharacterized protein YjbI with pentapeptide repeats
MRTRIINGKEYPDNLRGADLSGANLRYADLSDADLRGAEVLIGNREITL